MVSNKNLICGISLGLLLISVGTSIAHDRDYQQKKAPQLIRTFDHGTGISGLDFSADGKWLVACGNGFVRLWNVQDGRRMLWIKNKKRNFMDIRFHPNNNQFATGTRGGEVIIWNLKGLELANHALAGEPRVPRIAYSRDGNALAAACSDKITYIWRTDRQLHKLMGHTTGVQDVAFHPDGKRLVTSGADFTARIWDLQQRKNIHVLKAKSGGIVVHAVDISPDGRLAASAAGPGEVIHIWNAQSGKLIHSIETGHPGYAFRRVRFGPKGKLLAVCGGIFSRGYFSLWSIREQDGAVQTRRLAILQTNRRGAGISALCFHPERRMVATGNSEGKLRLWKTGK